MKEKQWVLWISLLVVMSVFLAACNGGSSGDSDTPDTKPPVQEEAPPVRTETDVFNEWKAKKTVWPAWATEQKPVGYGEGEASGFALAYNAYRTTRASYEGTEKAIKEIRYVIKNDQSLSEDERNMLTYFQATLLERMREDHLAHHHINKVNETGKTEATVTFPGRTKPYTMEFSERFDRLLLGIYSRNAFLKRMEAVITRMDAAIAADEESLPGDLLSQIGRAYYMAGMGEKALERFAIVGDETKFSRTYKMSSTTLGAVSIAYRLGEFEKVRELSQWMIDLGIDSDKFLGDGSSSYREDQWKCSYRQVEAWRDLAAKQGTVSFKDLDNGDYTVTTQGFRGPIHFTVTIADGLLQEVTVDGHMEDRPYNVFVTLPARWKKQKNMTVDAVSGATVTSGAVEMALIKALQEADSSN